MNRGDDVYDTAIESLGELGDLTPAPYAFNIDFDFEGQLTPFQRPTRPDLDASGFAFQSPDAIGLSPEYVPTPLTFTTSPEIDVIAPTLNLPARPDLPALALPIAPPPPDELIFPVEPDYELPPTPTFEELHLPDAPVVVIPTFDAVAPVFVEPPFDESWNFTPTAYEQVLLDDLTAKLRPMIQGVAALPEAIEQAIFEKMRSRIEIEVNRDVDQAMTEFSARGFAEPPGQLAGRVNEIRQGGANRIADASRDAALKQYEESNANLRFAITQGAALEGVFIQLHIEEQRFALQAAIEQRNSAVAILNARISIINARQAAYESEARVFESKLRASLATIEVYRAELEGELARGQINDQRIRLYEGLLRGVNVQADFYRNRIEAVKVRSDADRNVVERYKAEVDAYDSRIRAYSEEWRGYAAAADAEGKKADIFKSIVDANAKRVDAWATTNNLEVEKSKLHIAEHGQKLQAWEGTVRKFTASLEAEKQRLDAVAQLASSQAQLYSADASVEVSASAATDRSFELGMEKAKADAEAQYRAADLAIVQLKGMFDQLIAIKEATARIASQLASSTMSAVGYNAGVSSGHSVGQSCSTNFSFVGEVSDA